MPEMPTESPLPAFLTVFFASRELFAEASRESEPLSSASFPAMTRLLFLMFWMPTVAPMPTLLFSSVVP